jgi:hypothetical protein
VVAQVRHVSVPAAWADRERDCAHRKERVWTMTRGRAARRADGGGRHHAWPSGPDHRTTGQHAHPAARSPFRPSLVALSRGRLTPSLQVPADFPVHFPYCQRKRHPKVA